jgi:hypothetical protein
MIVEVELLVATHALVHDRRLNRWYLGPIREVYMLYVKT